MRKCKQCEGEMRKTASMVSSNANFETWQCNSCDYREEICTGMINQ